MKGSINWSDSYGHVESTDKTKRWDFNNQIMLTHYVLKCLLGCTDSQKQAMNKMSIHGVEILTLYTCVATTFPRTSRWSTEIL